MPSHDKASGAIKRFEWGLDKLLKWSTGLIILSMLIILLMAVVSRKIGTSMSWYDEVATILLAWLTYLGAALVALHRGHIGMGNLVEMSTGTLFKFLTLLRAGIISVFFLILAWQGMLVMEAMSGFNLVTVPWMPIAVTQAIIPIGSVLFVVAEFLSTYRVIMGLPSLAPHLETTE